MKLQSILITGAMSCGEELYGDADVFPSLTWHLPALLEVPILVLMTVVLDWPANKPDPRVKREMREPTMQTS